VLDVYLFSIAEALGMSSEDESSLPIIAFILFLWVGHWTYIVYALMSPGKTVDDFAVCSQTICGLGDYYIEEFLDCTP